MMPSPSLWNSSGGGFFIVKERFIAQRPLTIKKTKARISTTSGGEDIMTGSKLCNDPDPAKGSKETVKALFLVCFVI
jgi:hypothetical protein